MEAISNLPSDISGSLLSNWLDIVDIGELDSAVCCSKVRTLFLQLLASEFVVHPNSLQNINIPLGSFMYWLSLRQVK